MIKHRICEVHLIQYSHYEHLPRGPWWDLLVPDLTLIKTVVPNSYLGKEIKHFAHKADVLRLMAMKYSGGVYLDIDMFVWVTRLINRADRVESSLLTICSGSLLR